MFSFADLLGVSLNTKGEMIDTSTLNGKTVLLYFSAHWCPPCRQFTPVLAKFYNDLRTKRQDFEIVFLSSDRSVEEFDEYYKEHPWLAVPFSERKLKDKLAKRMKIKGIPALLVLDRDGEVLSHDGRAGVMEDPTGVKFPWKKRTVFDILASTTATKGGSPITVDDLKKLDSFGLYFSAHWCGPCRQFTPRLVSVYNKLVARNTKMEIIFCSSDRDAEQYQEYYAEMPWATLPFQDQTVRELSKLFGVEGIPQLVTIDKNGKTINGDARSSAGQDQDGAHYPWAPVPLSAVCKLLPSDTILEALNTESCIVLHVNGAPNKETLIAEFSAAAKSYDADENKKEKGAIARFFTVEDSQSEDLMERILELLTANKPQQGKAMVLGFNLPNSKAKEVLSGEISVANIRDFVARFATANA